VPAGPPTADRGFPDGLALPRPFPEHEVAGVVLFVLLVVNAGTHQIGLGFDPRELPVAGEGGDAVVDGVIAPVGVAGSLQTFNQLGHLLNVVGGARVVLGALDPQSFEVGEKGFDEAVGVIAQLDTGGLGLADGLVVDVGEVHDLGDLVTRQLQSAAQNVLEEEGPEIADVGVVVHRRPAGVEAHAAFLEGLEELKTPGKGVVETKGKGQVSLRAEILHRGEELGIRN